MAIILLISVLLPLLSCEAPGPLKAERKTDELYVPSEEELLVIEAILIVDAPFPPLFLRRTAPPGQPYDAAEMGVAGAGISMRGGDELIEYRDDPDTPGRYLPPGDAPSVKPDLTYELRVETEAGILLTTATHTPGRTHIDRLALLGGELIDGELEVIRHLRLFGEIGDEIYTTADNRVEYTEGILEARLHPGDSAAAYQFALFNLESNSPLLINRNWVDDENLTRRETAPLLRLEEDRIYLPWDGIYYAGRYKVKLFAVDRNWFDLVRTDNIQADRERGQAGEGFQRPLFHVENGIGLFASASVDSFGFFVQPKGNPDCEGCACWGCEDSRWFGRFAITGQGQFAYRREVIGGANCELSYAITDAAAIPPCPDCTFAWEFALSDLSIIRDEGGCGEAVGLNGATLRFGQGSEVVAVEDGVRRYRLYVESEGEWERAEDGWSSVPEEGEFAGRWIFGFSGD